MCKNWPASASRALVSGEDYPYAVRDGLGVLQRLARLLGKSQRPHFLSDRDQIQFTQSLAPDRSRQPLHLVEFALLPTTECLLLGRHIEYRTGFHGPTIGPRYLVVQPDMMAEEVAYREIGVKGAR
jgi:hypothetical protein